MEYLIVILSVSTVLCESSSKARVPLVDAVHAPLVAELDITGVKNELKEYIDVQVEKQVNQTSDGKIKTVVNEKVSELKSEMTEDFLNCLNQTEHACDVQVDALLRRFTVQNKLIEYFLKNKNKELKHNIKNIEDWKRPLIKDSELKSYFEELKSNLTSTQEKDLCKEKQRCFNGGTCQTNSSTFYCICTKGYIGENCQYTDGKGTSFVVIFQEIYRGGGTSDITPKLLVASERLAHLSVFYFHDNRNQTVIADKNHPEYTLDKSVLMQDGMNNVGIKVRSNVSVTMYGVLFQRSSATSEGFMVIPERFASTEFIIPSFSPYHEYSVIAITPLFDSTIVEIIIKIKSGTVKYDGTNYSNGDKILLTLNKYKTLQLSHSSDLSGTLVKASMPVVVVSGNTLTRVSTSGVSGANEQPFMEMILPTNQLDHLYVIPHLSTRPKSVVRILTVNATTLLIRNNNNKISKISNSRDYVDFTHNTVSYIQSSSDVLVMMYPEELPGSKGDAFMMTIPGVNQYLQSYDFVVPKGFTSFISITVSSEGVNGLFLDGQSVHISSMFSISEDSDHFSTFSIRITSGFHHIEHSQNLRFGVWVYGESNLHDAYGYPAGAAFKSFN